MRVPSMAGTRGAPWLLFVLASFMLAPSMRALLDTLRFALFARGV